MPSSRFSANALTAYLGVVHGRPVRAVRVTPLGGGRQGDKGYGYGIPLRVDYELDGAPRRAVVESVRPGPFGHEHMADRAQSLLWAHDAFGKLPRHVASLDVGAVRASGELVPLGSAEELFMLAEFIEGHEYADDLLRLRAGGEARALDVERADALCDYLVGIHRVPGTDPGLYVRRVRELLGHGECIFGVVDSLSGGWAGARGDAARDRAALPRVALDAEAAHAPPAPGARRFPSLEHPVPRGRGLQRARPLARRMGRRGRRRHLPDAQLPLLLAAALRDDSRAASSACSAASGTATSSARATRRCSRWRRRSSRSAAW